jgi:hypothetical protein
VHGITESGGVADGLGIEHRDVRKLIKEVYDDIWLVSFMDYDLGYFDLETRVLEPLENPFGPIVLPMCPVRSVTYVSGLDHETVEPRVGVEPTTCRLRRGTSARLLSFYNKHLRYSAFQSA